MDEKNPQYAEGSMMLPDGRRLAYIEYGDPLGEPVMVLHGTPGCRRLFSAEEPVARGLGLRLIAPDRPGYGLSDPKPGRSLADAAVDVEHLADGLGIGRYGVIGISAGGPFAAACAALGKGRVTAASLVMSATPPSWHRASARLQRMNRIVFFLGRYAPGLLAPIFQAQRYRAIKLPHSAGSSFFLECHRQGVAASVRDIVLAAKPWDIDFSSISIPMEIWHGLQDSVTPVEGARYLQARIPCATLHEVEGGHDLPYRPDLWSRILQGMKHHLHASSKEEQHELQEIG